MTAVPVATTTLWRVGLTSVSGVMILRQLSNVGWYTRNGGWAVMMSSGALIDTLSSTSSGNTVMNASNAARRTNPALSATGVVDEACSAVDSPGCARTWV